ncbi:MAG: (4Fe-4S)-binding protein [Candidatus Kapabacteria bacterium]|nr:(4Fe-4S)-binding protein [Candidatus Kapabacteria bacterium]
MTMNKKYSNGEITILWQPSLCSHSAQCFHGLPGVFDPRKRPWISPEGASTDAIIAQVQQCPSGALSFVRHDETLTAANDTSGYHTEPQPVNVDILNNGPLRVTGTFTIRHKDGRTETKEKASLCRCGASKNKPFCDGSHKAISPAFDAE